MKKINKVAGILFCAIIVLTFGVHIVYASTLDLLGIGWNKETVTIAINHGKGITTQSIGDVEQAISEWNTVLEDIDGAPLLQEVNNSKKADIVIHMKVGGGVTLGYTLPKTTSPFSCALNNVRVQLSGKAFGQPFSNAGTYNVALHELGHALGLGHSDNSSDLMYPTYDSSDIFGTDLVSISPCDIEGLDAIYPLPTHCDITGSVTCQ